MWTPTICRCSYAIPRCAPGSRSELGVGLAGADRYELHAVGARGETVLVTADENHRVAGAQRRSGVAEHRAAAVEQEDDLVVVVGVPGHGEAGRELRVLREESTFAPREVLPPRAGPLCRLDQITERARALALVGPRDLVEHEEVPTRGLGHERERTSRRPSPSM